MTAATTAPLIAFLVATIVPVFFGKIRSAPFWLMMQAAALAWNDWARDTELSGHEIWLLFELLVVRGQIVPALLRRMLRQRAGPDLDLMPSNLFTWAIAIALIVLAFEFGAPASTDSQALTLGAVGATVAVALLLLSTNRSPPAQLVALLFMENALALFESLLPEPWPLPVHVALTAIYLITVWVAGWLNSERETATPAPSTTWPEHP